MNGFQFIKGKVKGLRGELEFPGDRTISQKVELGALARGDTLRSGILWSQGCKDDR